MWNGTGEEEGGQGREEDTDRRSLGRGKEVDREE